MGPGSNRRRVALVAGLAGITALAVGLGWLVPARAWPEATGWSRIPDDQRPPIAPLWTPSAGAGATEAPAPTLTWLGHAGFIVEWQGVRVLLDPNTSGRCSIAPRMLERPPAFDDFGAPEQHFDAALVSHAHYDHLDLPTLQRIRALDRIVVPRGSEGYLPADLRQRARPVPLAVGASHVIGPLTITAVAARHNGGRHHPLASHHLAVGYVLRVGANALYFAGDTGFGDHFTAIRDTYRPRAAILPIGAYAPRIPLERYHLNPEQAVIAAQILGVETVVPCHFGTFVLSLDRPAAALPRFARAARAAGLAWRMPQLLGTAPVRGQP